jgi:hypothetical protein
MDNLAHSGLLTAPAVILSGQGGYPQASNSGQGGYPQVYNSGQGG